MADYEDLVERLSLIEEELRDRAFERLTEAAASGDQAAHAEEKRLLQARRAIARAIAALGGAPDA
jgi:hypothetical protein